MTLAPLASTAQLAAHLGVSSIDATIGGQALAGASGVVRDFCDWQISQVIQDTFVLDGNGTGLICMPTGLVTQVYSVQLDYMILQPLVHDGTVAGQYGYEWGTHGTLERGPMWYWPKGRRRVTVVLDHGYATIPDSVVGVTCAVAARAMDNPESVRMRRVGETSETYDGAALTAYGLSPNDMVILGRYRLGSLGR